MISERRIEDISVEKAVEDKKVENYRPKSDRYSRSIQKWVGVAMGQTSRIVTIIEGIEVIEVTIHDPQGDPIETRYHVRGEKYETLKQAMEAARRISEE
jgi:hypothetical protein